MRMRLTNEFKISMLNGLTGDIVTPNPDVECGGIATFNEFQVNLLDGKAEIIFKNCGMEIAKLETPFDKHSSNSITIAGDGGMQGTLKFKLLDK